MKNNLKACLTMTIASLTAIAGAEPLQTTSANPEGYAPPARFADGRINHQLDPDNPFVMLPNSEIPKDVTPVIVAGDPTGSPPDSPNARIVPNSLASAFSGTAQLFIGNAFLCSATPVADRYVISAGHCVDSNDNGTNDFGTNIRITISASSNSSTVIFPAGIAAVHTHPDYTGFANPTVNDDIIIIELANDLPAEVVRYPVYRGSLSAFSEIHLVGFGTTGDAVNGYINGSASFTTKRGGRNNPDRGFFADDEGSGIVEVFQYDFDNWQSGGLGNNIETTVGGGDSGGPSYIQVGSHLELWGINTFTSGPAPSFGSFGGGIVVNGYLDFIDSLIDPVPGVFSLTAPACGALNQLAATFLDWDISTLATSYTVTVATDAGLTNVVHTQAGLTSTNHFIPGGALGDCAQFFWSVSAINANGETIATNAVCSFSTAIVGDINADGVVDTADLGGLLGSFGNTTPFGDLNGDGIVDTADLGILLAVFGQSCL